MNDRIVGANPERVRRYLEDGTWVEDGTWDTEGQARQAFVKEMLELLDSSEWSTIFVRRKPMFETVRLFSEDKPRYRMVARFQISEDTKPKIDVESLIGFSSKGEQK